ncbi:ARM repeat-containing protein [Rickenella mellea]|uniref:ARM repeat-containing protein n=1 Tax=Rickenella mellea TaxID=50990 RepID=A0A4R5XF60_9AGAM|nr:ARM repeat-containing protein [Rickenella mellea]
MSSKLVQTVSYEELYNVVCGASSTNPTIVTESSLRLKAMLEMSGTFDALSIIATQKQVPLAVRQQSIIQFKNNALSHWRSRKLLSDKQRVDIRGRWLTLLDESDDIISKCNEIIVAKTARQDYPLNWPGLIGHLVDSINVHLDAWLSQNSKPSSTLILRRSFELLNGILKEFATIKMPAGIKVLGTIIDENYLVLQQHYTRLTAALQTSLVPGSLGLERTAECMFLAHIAFKCLVKMVVWLFNKLGSQNHSVLENWCKDFFQNSTVQIQNLYELRMKLIVAMTSQKLDSIQTRSLDYLTRHVRLFGKLFRRLQQLSPSRFVALPLCSDLIFYYWSKVIQSANGPPALITDSPDAIFPIQFIVQAMVLFKDSLSQWTPVRKDGTANDAALSKDFVEDAVRVIVTRFLPLSPKDLDSWMADPEEWVNTEEHGNEQWEYELRPCAERVLITLSNQYKDVVAPLLLATFGQVVGQETPDLESVIQKEALYCAVGRCATRLKSVIPFDDWLEKTLVVESQDPDPNYPIIKRRIAWDLGRWVSEDCTSPSRNPRIWEVLVFLLRDRGTGTDTVVHLTAAVALRDCIDANSFDADIFAPHLPSVISELVRLASEADMLETKRRITDCLNTVIERVGKHIVPFVEIITTPIPQLWNAAGTDYIFKTSILVTVTKVIDSSKEHSASLGGLVVPLVRESFSDEGRMHLDEDGLVLWLSSLRNGITIESVNGAAALYDLFPIAVVLLGTNLDLLGKILSVVEAYFILDGTKILQGHALSLFQAFDTAMKQATTINVKGMITALNLLVLVTPAQLWAEPMHISGLFPSIITAIKDDKDTVLLLTEYVILAARMALSDAAIFLQLMSAASGALNVPETELWEGLLNQWWNRFDNMSEPQYRKLAAMGIANLVATGRPEVLDRLSSEIFNLWLDVFGEIKEAHVGYQGDNDGMNTPLSPGSPSPLVLYWHNAEEAWAPLLSDAEGTLEFDRRKTIYGRDPVTKTKLTPFVANSLQTAQNVYPGGPQAFEVAWLKKADPTVLKQLQEELASNR